MLGIVPRRLGIIVAMTLAVLPLTFRFPLIPIFLMPLYFLHEEDPRNPDLSLVPASPILRSHLRTSC
jgi:hypothetical protein